MGDKLEGSNGSNGRGVKGSNGRGQIWQQRLKREQRSRAQMGVKIEVVMGGVRQGEGNASWPC
jgi:hypothetical protein